MCKIIHPTKMSDESYKVFKELLPILYREIKGQVVYNDGLPVLIPCNNSNNDCGKFYYNLPLDSGMTYNRGDEIIVWVLRDCLFF